MKVLDTSFLVDYGNGLDAAGEYFEEHADQVFVLPAPVYTEYLLGTAHSDVTTDLAEARRELAWGEVVDVTTSIAVVTAEIADEIGPRGPELTAIDALVAATGRELGASIVSADSDLTHEATKAVVDVAEY